MAASWDDFPEALTPGEVFTQAPTAGVGDGFANAQLEFSLRNDLRHAPGVLWADTLGLYNVRNGLITGAALAAAIGLRMGLDDEVRADTRAHPDRWGAFSDQFGKLGNPEFQVPVLTGIWLYSTCREDPELHDLSSTLISAYTLNGLATVAIKGIANTHRPDADWNGGRWGFPSFHTSSTFTIASVLDEYYGWQVGLPAYAVAGLVGWCRIDSRDHDLSDVAFGAALGWIIGKSVAGQHLRGDGRVRLLPYWHPTAGCPGALLEVSF